MRRIEAGPFRSTTSDGGELRTDHPLSTSQADVLSRVIAASGFTPDEVFAVELNECGCVVEFRRPDWRERLLAGEPEDATHDRCTVPPSGGRGVAISPDRRRG